MHAYVNVLHVHLIFMEPVLQIRELWIRELSSRPIVTQPWGGEGQNLNPAPSDFLACALSPTQGTHFTCYRGEPPVDQEDEGRLPGGALVLFLTDLICNFQVPSCI